MDEEELEAAEFAELSEEAKAESAPVAADLAYKPRTAWKPGDCVGFIIADEKPNARVRWPRRGSASRDFWARINGVKE